MTDDLRTQLAKRLCGKWYKAIDPKLLHHSDGQILAEDQFFDAWLALADAILPLLEVPKADVNPNHEGPEVWVDLDDWLAFTQARDKFLKEAWR